MMMLCRGIGQIFFAHKGILWLLVALFTLVMRGAVYANDQQSDDGKTPFDPPAIIQSRGDVAELHAFSGACRAGSFIELYLEGGIVGTTNCNPNGSYLIPDIAVRYGHNSVKIGLRLPEGQYEERQEDFDIPRPNASSTAVDASVSSSSPTPPAIAGLVQQIRGTNYPSLMGADSAPRSGNEILLNFVTETQQKFPVTAFLDKQNIYVPLLAVARVLKVECDLEQLTSGAVIKRADNPNIRLDFDNNVYGVDNDMRVFYAYDWFRRDSEYWVNLDFINRILPEFGLVADLGQGRIYVSSSHDHKAFDVAPRPLVSPLETVIVDNVTDANLVQTHPTIPEAEGDVLSSTEQVPAPQAPLPSVPEKAGAALPAEVKKDDEEETLILQPLIKDLPPSDQFIECFKKSGQVFIPLNDIIQLFGFPIRFNQEANKFGGFFIKSDNEFELDLAQKNVRWGGKKSLFTESDIQTHDQQVFISTKSFMEWFGISSEIDTAKLTIHFMTDALLPQEEDAERQKRWQALLRNVEPTDKDYPVLQNGYQALGYPSFDVNLGSLYRASNLGGTSSQFQSSYNIQGAGDIAYLTGKVYAQGSTTGTGLDNLRFQLGRVDPNAQLLGGLKASEFEIGDVTSPSLALVTSNSLGRGATITNRDINAAENFDYRNFSGDAVPGYQVELYRNDVLLAFQTADASGRYNFENIPILYGENIFRIVLYGQQGQREERTEAVSASSALLKANRFTYQVGVDERGQSFLPVSPNNQNSVFTPSGAQVVSDFHYGVNDDLTVGAALAETRLADGEHQFVQTSFGSNIFGILTEGDFARDVTQNGWAASASALSGFEGVSLRLRYRKFNDFVSEAVNNISTPLTSDASLDANTQFLLPVLGSYSMGLSALHETFVDPSLQPRDTFSWRSSKSLWGLSFTDSVDYITGQDHKLQDTFGVQTRLFNTDFRAVGVTDLTNQKLSDISFMANYNLSHRLSGQTQIDKNLLSNQETYSQNIFWDFDDFRLSLSGQMIDTQNYTLGMNLIFSVNHDPVTGKWRTQPQATSDSGAISGRVYVSDEDGVSTQNLPTAKVKINKLLIVPDEDDFFAAPVPPYQKNIVEFDPNSVADPLLTPETTGFQVVTRPGDNVVVDIPLVHTTIIDGTVYLTDDNGNKRVLSDVVVELDGGDGKPLKRVLSGIDGYFSFDKVKVGDYALSVPDEALAAINADLDNKVVIKIDKIDDFITGKDISLHQKQKLDLPPTPQ